MRLSDKFISKSNGDTFVHGVGIRSESDLIFAIWVHAHISKYK